MRGQMQKWDAGNLALVPEIYVVDMTADASPSSTTNVTLTGVSQAVTCPGTSAAYLVTIDARVHVQSAATINEVELLVDGVAQTPALQTGLVIIRVQGHQTWLVTGLAAGTRTFTARTHNTASTTVATVRADGTRMTVQRVR